MLDDIRSGEIDGILFWALDRISRNNVDSALIQWVKLGVNPGMHGKMDKVIKG